MCIIRSITTDSLKVTECFLQRAEWVPSFISWGEWQIQHNASLSSEHFTVGLNMWPWFRWMSTSHLYSSNLRLLTETSAWTTAPTPSLARFPNQQCSLCSWDKPAKVKPPERRPARGRSTPTVRMLTRRQSQSRWSRLWLRDAPKGLAEETTDPHNT